MAYAEAEAQFLEEINNIGITKFWEMYEGNKSYYQLLLTNGNDRFWSCYIPNAENFIKKLNMVEKEEIK